jgi:hypothetical protein
MCGTFSQTEQRRQKVRKVSIWCNRCGNELIGDDIVISKGKEDFCARCAEKLKLIPPGDTDTRPEPECLLGTVTTQSGPAAKH